MAKRRIPQTVTHFTPHNVRGTGGEETLSMERDENVRASGEEGRASQRDDSRTDSSKKEFIL